MMIFRQILLGGWVMLAASFSGFAAQESGDVVVVVYNQNMPESREVAEYYAQKRAVPDRQVFGFDLPKTESMTRTEFREKLQEPLLRELERARLLVFGPASDGKGRTVLEAKIRYATLCYGVPVKIQNDPKLVEAGSDKIRPELRRNEAAVDSELALLPQAYLKPPIYGAVQNSLFATTNAFSIHPTNGVLMVARLDGPSAELARGLVDKALQAEREGLWGRAYFDSRGIREGSYKPGDDWIRSSAEMTRRLGFETILDEAPGTFPPGYPMSHIAIYAGWYDGQVSGPFMKPDVEFMPGAIGYHLHSFSAHTLRSANHNWVGPLVHRGVTATMGCTEEPYLEGTPEIAVFFSRLTFLGFSFGEAALASQNSLSWQITNVGDPLYRPFARKPQDWHEQMIQTRSPDIEWSHLKVVNINLATGLNAGQLIDYLEDVPEIKTSAVLLEKLAELYFSSGKIGDSIDPYAKALELSKSPNQRLRLSAALGRNLELYGRNEQAFTVYNQLVKEFPEYANALDVYRKLVRLASELQRPKEVEVFQQEVQRLTPAGS